jgi:hypothetical protein
MPRILPPGGCVETLDTIVLDCRCDRIQASATPSVSLPRGTSYERHVRGPAVGGARWIHWTYSLGGQIPSPRAASSVSPQRQADRPDELIRRRHRHELAGACVARAERARAERGRFRRTCAPAVHVVSQFEFHPPGGGTRLRRLPGLDQGAAAGP